MSDTVNVIAFGALALATVGGSLGMLFSKNVVHAAYWLLGVCVTAAGLYFLLAAEYVAIVQLLIYAGALAILLIFTIMITLRDREDAVRTRDFSVSGALLAVVFFALVVTGIVGWKPQPVDLSGEVVPTLARFGEVLYHPEGWAIQFEVASLVLTAALVAAVLWSREGDE